MFPSTRKIKDPCAIFGIIVGLATNDFVLVRKSMGSLLGSKIKKNVLNGIFGMIFNDDKLEKDIKYVANLLGLN